MSEHTVDTLSNTSIKEEAKSDYSSLPYEMVELLSETSEEDMSISENHNNKLITLMQQLELLIQYDAPLINKTFKYFSCFNNNLLTKDSFTFGKWTFKRKTTLSRIVEWEVV